MTARSPVEFTDRNLQRVGNEVVITGIEDGAIQGPGEPVIDNYQDVPVTLAANTANQQIIAAPGANKQIWIYALHLMADTDAGTIRLEDSAGVAITGISAVSDEGGWVWPPSGNFSMPWAKVPTGRALRADTVTCSAAGIIAYAIVSV